VHCKAPPSDKIRRIRKKRKKRERKRIQHKEKKSIDDLSCGSHLSLYSAASDSSAAAAQKNKCVYRQRGKKGNKLYGTGFARCKYQLNKIGSSYLTSGITADRNIS
jgi:hypothetical protein